MHIKFIFNMIVVSYLGSENFFYALAPLLLLLFPKLFVKNWAFMENECKNLSLSRCSVHLTHESSVADQINYMSCSVCITLVF